MMRCGKGLGALNRETDKIYLMYSAEDTKFSEKFLKKAKNGEFIKE